MDINKIHDTLIDYMNEDAAKKILDMIRPEQLWVATAVDYGESCDGKARVLGVFSNEDDAKGYVRNDMEDYCDQFAGDPDIVCDFDKMYVTLYDGADFGCEWNVEAVEVK